MDLAGPRVRTGECLVAHGDKHAFTDDLIAIVAPGALQHPGARKARIVVECALPEAIAAAELGHRLFIDGGKIAAVIMQAEGDVLIARVTRTNEQGIRIKPEKGINFPDTPLDIPALTAKDREDLKLIAAHADGIEFSFVQSVEDIESLHKALAEIRPDWDALSLILKIETLLALQNLPEIIVWAGAAQPVAVMIARGDLAIEIGYARLAEIQEEIL